MLRTGWVDAGERDGTGKFVPDLEMEYAPEVVG